MARARELLGRLGKFDWRRGAPSTWHDYRALGLGPGDVSELAALATDPVLNPLLWDPVADDSELDPAPDSPRWIGAHAVRALVQIAPLAGLTAILTLMHTGDVHDELSAPFWEAIVTLGPTGLPVLHATVADTRTAMEMRTAIVLMLADGANELPGCTRELRALAWHCLREAVEWVPDIPRDHHYPEPSPQMQLCLEKMVEPERLARIRRGSIISDDIEFNGALIVLLAAVGAPAVAGAPTAESFLERLLKAGRVSRWIFDEWEQLMEEVRGHPRP